MKILATLLTSALLGAAALAGPIPFTQNQFPLWFATGTTPQSLTNLSAETDMAIIPLPASVMGNTGFMNITLLSNGDAGSTNKIFTVYLGGQGHTNATALYTNTFKQTTATPISARIVPYVGGYSNIVYSTLYTNSLAGALKQTVVVGSQTNGLFLTITGNMADNHGTYITLDGYIIEALSQ